MSVFDNMRPRLKAKNDVKCGETSNVVSPHLSHYAQIWMKCVDIKNPPLFYLVGLRPFDAPSCRAYPNVCCIKHSCGDITV